MSNPVLCNEVFFSLVSLVKHSKAAIKAGKPSEIQDEIEVISFS